MGSSILQLAFDAADDLNIERPLSLFGAYNEGDTNDRRLVRAMARTCTKLAALWDWQVLRQEQVFASLHAPVQTGMIPADFLRFIDGTFWDRSAKLRLRGPLPPNEWQTIQTWQTSGSTASFCQRGNDILTYPVPPAGKVYAFEYIANTFAVTAGVKAARFTTDQDTTLWDDELMTLGIILHYRMARRMDYAADDQAFQMMMHDRIKQDGGRRVINMGGRQATGDSLLNQIKSAAVIVNGAR